MAQSLHFRMPGAGSVMNLSVESPGAKLHRPAGGDAIQQERTESTMRRKNAHTQVAAVRRHARAFLRVGFSLLLLSATLLGGFSRANAQNVNSLSVAVTNVPGVFTLSVLPPYTSNTQPLGLQVSWDVNKATRLEIWADFPSNTAFRSISTPANTIAANAVEAQSVGGCSVCSGGWTAFGAITDWAGRPLGTPGAAFRIDSRSTKGNPRDNGTVNESVNLRVNLSNYFTTVAFASDYRATLTIHVQVF